MFYTKDFFESNQYFQVDSVLFQLRRLWQYNKEHNDSAGK
jgi:hypothetical protein